MLFNKTDKIPEGLTLAMKANIKYKNRKRESFG